MSAPRFTPEELAAATGGRWIDSPPPVLEGLSTDTRAVAPAGLFVALRGERFDAHEFLEQAWQGGAVAAVVEQAWLDGGGRAGPRAPPLSPGHGGGQAPALLVVADTLVALGAVARLHRRRFSLPVVGITGSNGKTTTREMISAILATRGLVLRAERNLNNEVGVPLTLLRLGPEHTSAVIEMGMNHAGEIARIAAIAEPQVGVVTNALPAHLEGLGTVDAVADAKAELYQGLPPDGVAVANADDPRMLRRAQQSGRRLITFAVGRQRRGDVVVLDILAHDHRGLRFLLGIGNRELEIRLPLVGRHNAANAAAAAATAAVLGCTDREIIQGLTQVQPVGNRLRMTKLPSGLTLVVDCYNANPVSMDLALQALAEMAGADPSRRPVAILGDMLELGPIETDSHRELGERAAATVKLLAAFGPRSRLSVEAARTAGLPEPATFQTEDMEDLIAWAQASLSPRDIVLVKGSRGMKLERLVEALH
jgi:UDP-N-acetylmuramoyl-tripeptide--D-alanyl-D-alanine ligase